MAEKTKGKMNGLRLNKQDEERLLLIASRTGQLVNGKYSFTKIIEHCIRYRALELIEPTLKF